MMYRGQFVRSAEASATPRERFSRTREKRKEK